MSLKQSYKNYLMQAQYEVSSDMYIRCTLHDETKSVTRVRVGFVN